MRLSSSYEVIIRKIVKNNERTYAFYNNSSQRQYMIFILLRITILLTNSNIKRRYIYTTAIEKKYILFVYFRITEIISKLQTLCSKWWTLDVHIFTSFYFKFVIKSLVWLGVKKDTFCLAKIAEGVLKMVLGLQVNPFAVSNQL